MSFGSLENYQHILGTILVPSYIIGKSGRLILSNKRGEDLLAKKSVVELSDEHLKLSGLAFSGQRSRLTEFISAPDDAEIKFFTPNGDAGKRSTDLKVAVIPVQDSRSRPLFAVLVFGTQGKYSALAEEVRSLFPVTVTESEIAAMMLSGHDITEIASIRSVSEETTRKQVKSILQKSSTRRQMEFTHIAGTLLNLFRVSRKYDQIDL